MDEILKLFGVMLAIMVPVAIGGGVFVVIGHLTKRLKARRGPAASQELEELRARVEELEHGQRQVHELAERVDFVERMLPALREGKP
jgi:Tfp pilus assembly protein PilO